MTSQWGALQPTRRRLPRRDPARSRHRPGPPSPRWVQIVLLAGALLAAGACGPGGTPSTPGAGTEAGDASLPDLFQDVTPGSGVDFAYRNGEEAGHYAILESLGGGVALLDYDGDGLLDLF